MGSHHTFLAHGKRAHPLITQTGILWYFYTLPKVHKLSKELQSHLSCKINSSDRIPDFDTLSVPEICQLAKAHSISVPGRPIISGIGTLTEGLSGYVDCILNPLLHKIPSYLQDSTHFLRIINNMGTLPTEALLVIMDVTSQYTNIPHEEGARACK